MNLIMDPWIPVRCASGESRLISPLQLLDEDDPPEELDAIRPDFNVALAQFLVGLMQWLAPDDEAEWRRIAQGRERPELERLHEIASCFEFDNGPRRFMQDMDFEPDEAGDLSALLLEAPGGKTLRDNTDLFVKRSEGTAMSLPIAAQALLTLQINAPAGGQGHRTSVRGGGPVSMLLWPAKLDGQTTPLWRKLWINTLVLEGDAPRLEVVFPWMAPCLTSEGGRDVHTCLAGQPPSEIEEVLLCYFATPRRIRLHFEADGICSLTGQRGPCATAMETRNYGANYRSDLFQHPLSPYYMDKSGGFLPAHVRETGFTYADWILTCEDSEQVRMPRALRMDRLGMELRAQLPVDPVWASGFAMDNMKCLAWHEVRFRHLDLDEERKAPVLHEVHAWLDGVDHVRRELSRQLRLAWGASGSGDTSVAERELFSRTEEAFHQMVGELAALDGVTEQQRMQCLQDMRRRWQRQLADVAMRIFQQHAERGDAAEASVQALERVALAHRNLSQAVHGGLAKKLGLVTPAAKAGRATGTRRKEKAA